jgi:hypothetical protein
MTPAEYRAAIARLELSQVAAGKVVGADPRTSRRWASGASPVPAPVRKLLALMLTGKITPLDLEAIQ